MKCPDCGELLRMTAYNDIEEIWTCEACEQEFVVIDGECYDMNDDEGVPLESSGNIIRFGLADDDPPENPCHDWEALWHDGELSCCICTICGEYKIFVHESEESGR